MATPTQLRRDLENLTTLADRDLAALWRQVSDMAQAREALNDVLPDLITTYGLAASAIASDWYDEAAAKAGAGGRFAPIVPDIGDPGVPSLVSWATTEAKALETLPTLVIGGVQRRISNVARDTVTQTSVADPRTDGWMRVGVGQCSFCQMLIGRGAVYTESTVNFGAHDHCKCQAAPAFPGKPPIDVAEYRASTRRTAEQKATENARAREWIANNL